MREGDGAGAEGDDGADVDAGVAKGDGEEGLEVGHAQLGGLADAEGPEGAEVRDADGHLDGGDGPGIAEDVEGLLVVDVVADVEEVPEGEVSAGHEGVLQAGLVVLGGLGGGTSRGREGDGGGRSAGDGLERLDGSDGGGGLSSSGRAGTDRHGLDGRGGAVGNERAGLDGRGGQGHHHERLLHCRHHLFIHKQ